MFVEEGFRVRFANGETIDFYADSAADKDKWMAALAEVVGKESKPATSWTDIVLKREKMQAAKAKGAAANSAAMGMKSGQPASGQRKPSKDKAPYSRPSSQQGYSRPPPVRPQSQQNTRPRSADKPLPNPGLLKEKKVMTPAERRQKSRSMVF